MQKGAGYVFGLKMVVYQGLVIPVRISRKKMKIGTQLQIIKPHKVSEDFVLTVDQIPQYHYSIIIPKRYCSGHHVVDKAVAATILTVLGYITDWELEQVAKWVNKINPHLLFEVMRICNKIREGK